MRTWKNPQVQVCWSGIFPLSHGLNGSDRPFEQSQILYSRTTDHITKSSKYFHTYVACPSRRKIITAYRSWNIIAEKDNIKISSHLVFEDVLHVPEINTNIMSVIRLSNDLNCKTTFFPFPLWFLGLGHTETRNWLYYFYAPRLSPSTTTIDSTNKL